MAVTGNSEMFGSIGGGIMEYEMVEYAKTLLSKVVPDLKAEEVKHTLGQTSREILDALFARADDNKEDSKSPIQ